MGLFTAAVISNARSYGRAAERARAARDRERERAARNGLAAAMFLSPTRGDVVRYLDMKAASARSPERAAAYRMQADAVHAGRPYTVSANPDTGRVTVRVR